MPWEPPRLTIKSLLVAHWTGTAPTFTADTLDQSKPGDVVNIRVIRESPSDLAADTVEHRIELGIEIYTRVNEAQREALCAEVSRIIDVYIEAPGGSLVYLERGFRSDIGDDPWATPPIYLSSISVTGVWYD